MGNAGTCGPAAGSVAAVIVCLAVSSKLIPLSQACICPLIGVLWQVSLMSFARPQANVDAALPPEEWPLEALAKKMQQYCPMLSDLSAEGLAAESRGGYEALRAYLRRRGADAYCEKVRSE